MPQTGIGSGPSAGRRRGRQVQSLQVDRAHLYRRRQEQARRTL